MSLKTFSRGGVHPPENKLSSGKAIQELAPARSSSHPGIPAPGGPCQRYS